MWAAGLPRGATAIAAPGPGAPAGPSLPPGDLFLPPPSPLSSLPRKGLWLAPSIAWQPNGLSGPRGAPQKLPDEGATAPSPGDAAAGARPSHSLLDCSPVMRAEAPAAARG